MNRSSNPHWNNFSILHIDGETWHPIPRYEGKYEISNYARIKSLIKEYPTICRQRITQFYLRVSFRLENKSKDLSVHRLSAMTFIPNPENKPFVNHKYGDKLDARPGNLEWSTQSENAKHAYSTGLAKAQMGEENSCSKLNSKQVLEIFNSALKHRELSVLYGVSTTQITKIKLGQSWTHITKKEYKPINLAPETILSIYNSPIENFEEVATIFETTKRNVVLIKGGWTNTRITGASRTTKRQFITPEIADEIKKCPLSNTETAKLFGVCKNSVGNIRNGKESKRVKKIIPITPPRHPKKI